MLTSLGIGEALISALDEKGRPTPLAATMMRAPMSRMGILTPQEINNLTHVSQLFSKYNKTIDRESAYEILNHKIKRAEEEDTKEKAKKERETVERTASKSRRSSGKSQGAILKVLTSATFIRGVMSILNKALK